MMFSKYGTRATITLGLNFLTPFLATIYALKSSKNTATQSAIQSSLLKEYLYDSNAAKVY